MGFIQDDESVVERSAAHEGQRGDLDDAALHQLVDFLVAQDVVERIVERAQIGIDLFGDVAGKEPEALARFHRRPAEHDALDGLLRERCRCRRHRQESLACTSRADGHGDVELLHGLQIKLLRHVAGRDHSPDSGLHGVVGEEIDQVGFRAVAQHSHAGGEIRFLHRISLFDEVLHLAEELLHRRDAFDFSLNVNLIAAR